MEKGTEVLLEIPGVGSSAACRGRVVEVTEDSRILVDINNRELELVNVDAVRATNSELLAFYQEHGGEFVQQAVRLTASELIRSADDGGNNWQTRATLEPLAPARTADRRACPRVSTREMDLRIDFEDEIGCSVIDVSINGFSILARDRHVAGSIVPLTLHFRREVLVGTGAIQTLDEVGGVDGCTRYGLRVLDRRDSLLSAAMPRVYAAIRGAQSGVDEIDSIRDAIASADDVSQSVKDPT